MKWKNLRDWHEMYCAGHLIEGAVAYYQATGKRVLLDAMMRFADHIGAVFGRGPGQKRGYCGHAEIELALVKLANATGERRYMDLAKYMIDERGQQPQLLRHRGARTRATIRPSSGSRTTNTTSRTSPFASRIRRSGMRCARCICSARWLTSPMI